METIATSSRETLAEGLPLADDAGAPDISFQKKRTKSAVTPLGAAAWRFFGLWSLISLIALFYRLHPYYRRPWFEPWQWALTFA